MAGSSQFVARRSGAGIRRDERGVALLIVLLVLVLLVTAVVEFTYGTKLAMTSAANFRDGTQATYLVKSGITAARAILRDDARNSAQDDDLTETWAGPLPTFSVGDGTVAIAITDESGKISVNQMAGTDATRARAVKEMLQRLLSLLNLNPAIADLIKDFVDSDTVAEPSGREDSAAKNAKIYSLAELLRISEITPEVFRKLAPYLTPTDAFPININTAEPLVLRALHPDLGEEGARRIIEGRPHTDANLPNIDQTVASAIKAARILGWRSGFFSVRAEGTVHDTIKRAQALLQRKGDRVEILYWQME